jgi:serine---pyruvate transaminase
MTSFPMRLRLATPGPTEVPNEVLVAGAREILHHRSPEFRELMESTNAGLQRVFRTKQPVFTMLGGGTGVMEAAVVNAFAPDEHVLVLRNGYFGERFVDICRMRGLRVTSVDAPWGVAVAPDRVAKVLDEYPDVCGVLAVYSETSSGGINDVRALGELCAGRDVVLVVDAISALIAHSCPMDDWGIDILLAASHKAFMMPPGLAFAAISDKAWERVDRTRAGTYYFSFARHRKFWPLAPSSPGVSLVAQLKAALGLIEAEGLDAAAQRHASLALAAQRALQALGFRLFVEDPASRSHAVTAGLAPSGVDTERLLDLMRRKYGLTTTGGQGELKGRLLRLGHIGAVDGPQLMAICGVLEMALHDLGHAFEPGASMAAIEGVFR